ncbi:unnamed protein product [Penicillium camemberti]|uniref:Str. FM013 n=1 Tax=Penicillium camemberti (strain FM 013) TaxID=1429867 RepID=A0A0G4PKV6_PENC3|nr:unnamed protein product [Penicillium camemberti]
MPDDNQEWDRRTEVMTTNYEMIVWIIHNDQDGRKCHFRRRLLFSRNHRKIFPTIANYDHPISRP